MQNDRLRAWSFIRPLALAGALAAFGATDARAQFDPYTDVLTTPTPSLYGGVGLLDMRSARFMPDGYFWIDTSLKMPDDRLSLNFQAAPWLETDFRYAINYALPPVGQRALYDRSFDAKFRLSQETQDLPQVALGFQDFIGTGIYSAEYLVASKYFGPVDATLGMGWGRLGSRGAAENPFCALDPNFCIRIVDATQTGGQFDTSFFHGHDIGLFGGIEYHTPIDRLSLKVEYSSDDYHQESSYIQAGLPRQGHIYSNYAPEPINYGVAYRLWSNVDVGVAYMYNHFIALNIDIIANPSEPTWDVRLDPQPPFVARSPEVADALSSPAPVAAPDPNLDPSLKTTFVDLTKLPALDTRPPDPAMAAAAPPASKPPPTAKPVPSGTGADILATMQNAIEAQKLRVDGIKIVRDTVKVEIENLQYLRDTEAISRTLRVLSATAPASINVFEVTTAFSHVPLTTVVIPRAQADAMGQQIGTPAELWSSSILSDAKPSTRYGTVQGFPRLSWSLFPAVREDFFDPNNPLYIGFGVAGSTHLELLPGLTLDDQATYGLFNNFGSITRSSNSVLPHVRSDIALYLKDGFTGIDNLSTSYYAKPAPEIYTRFTAGYIENMFAAVGGETLYRPFGQRWAVGADLYEAYQRNTDDLFGFGQYNYHVLTGHVSFYVETPWDNFVAVVRAGRYLAGDYGGTLEVYRRFDSGIEVGAWMTLTNVPFSQFGEGSFDKGIKIVIPTEWALPTGSNSDYELDLRPVQRDGGQPLLNDATLYDLTQSSSYGDLQRQWPHVFQ
ncbi:MAG: YjbH domain-containing protein [Rhizomicrobium sp.]